MTCTSYTRRVFAASLFGMAASCGKRQQANTELRVGVVPEETESSRQLRYQNLTKYLGRKLNIPATVHEAADYAGVIEALKAGHLELAFLGPAAYARSWLVTNGQVEPLLAAHDHAGHRGTSSVFVVRADSKLRSLADLRGKTLAVADPNSTTSYQAPLYYLRREGIDANRYFKKLVFAGNHENAVVSVVNGTYEAAATWWMSEERSSFQRMIAKKMIPSGSLRIAWTSPVMASSPWTVPSRLDQRWKDTLRTSMMNLKTDDPEIWQEVSSGVEGGYYTVTHKDYVPIVEMIQENAKLRRSS